MLSVKTIDGWHGSAVVQCWIYDQEVVTLGKLFLHKCDPVTVTKQ